MRILSGVTDQVVYFVAVDSTDYVTRETGLTAFTVYRSRNGGTATAMTTPTITEVDATNMPGVYTLLLSEDMTIGTGNLSEDMTFHVTQAAMAPVTLNIELYDFNNFDAANDTVAHVTLVDTTTTNTDMRGTDSAATASALATTDGKVDTINTNAAAVKAVTDAIPDAGALTALLASIAAILEDTGTTIPAQITALNNLSAADILTTALTESYAADGAEGTLTQILYLIQQRITEAVQSGTTISIKGLDGTTEKATLTVDNATVPATITRAS